MLGTGAARAEVATEPWREAQSPGTARRSNDRAKRRSPSAAADASVRADWCKRARWKRTVLPTTLITGSLVADTVEWLNRASCDG